MAPMSNIIRQLEAQGVRLPKIKIAAPALVKAQALPPVTVSPASKTARCVSGVAERRAKVAALWREGKSHRAIAAALNVPAKLVDSDVFQLRRAGQIGLRVARDQVAPRRESIAALWWEGVTAAMIAETLGLSLDIVRSDIGKMQQAGQLSHRQYHRRADRKAA